MRARYYDSSTARFAQEDPIGLYGGQNRYRYVNNRPITHSDALGSLRTSPDIPTLTLPQSVRSSRSTPFPSAKTESTQESSSRTTMEHTPIQPNNAGRSTRPKCTLPIFPRARPVSASQGISILTAPIAGSIQMRASPMATNK